MSFERILWMEGWMEGRRWVGERGAVVGIERGGMAMSGMCRFRIGVYSILIVVVVVADAIDVGIEVGAIVSGLTSGGARLNAT